MNEIKLPTGSRLVLSSSPHLSGGASLQKIMGGVLLALLPPVIAAVWWFGWRALYLIILTTVFCVGAEALWCFLSGKPLKTVADGSAAVTGVLLALCLPVGVTWYIPLIGAFLAIWLGKQLYGGLGNNPFNPALVARVGLLIALPAAMTTWSPSKGMTSQYPEVEIFYSPTDFGCMQKGANIDAMTCATPLGIVGTTGKIIHPTPTDLEKPFFQDIDNAELMTRYFWGDRAGCLGETCVPALLLGYILLVVFNLVNWRVPLLFVGTVALITGIVNYFFPGVTPTPLFHIISGGLLLGAIYMATDMVTSPITGTGCIIFAIGCGAVTSVIRIWGNYPEGVSFAILFMNALVPLIDRWCGQRPFGYVRERKENQS